MLEVVYIAFESVVVLWSTKKLLLLLFKVHTIYFWISAILFRSFLTLKFSLWIVVVTALACFEGKWNKMKCIHFIYFFPFFILSPLKILNCNLLGKNVFLLFFLSLHFFSTFVHFTFVFFLFHNDFLSIFLFHFCCCCCSSCSSFLCWFLFCFPFHCFRNYLSAYLVYHIGNESKMNKLHQSLYIRKHTHSHTHIQKLRERCEYDAFGINKSTWTLLMRCFQGVQKPWKIARNFYTVKKSHVKWYAQLLAAICQIHYICNEKEW